MFSPESKISPYINHFLQPDTIIPDLSNPQSWNRYSYVTNRPLSFNDPTGHWVNETNDPIQEQLKLARKHAEERVKSNLDRNKSVKDDDQNQNDPDKYGGDPEIPISEGWRWPDYGTAQISVGPWWGGVFTFMWADGHLYISAGGTLGKPLADIAIAGIPIAGNLSGGWVNQSSRPTPDQMRRFLTGWAINLSGGFVGGVGVTWGQVGKFVPDAVAGEAGIYAPQIGVSATYTVVDVELDSGTLEWLPCNELILHKSC